MYALTGLVYFAVYLPVWLCLGRPVLGIALGILASVAWMILADWRYGTTFFWWTGLRKKKGHWRRVSS